MPDRSWYKLGRLPRKFRDSTPKLHNFLDATALPQVPDAFRWSASVTDWPMLGNDRLSNCTAAAAFHMKEAWSCAAGHPYIPSLAEAIALYENFGYSPDVPGSDEGAACLDVLTYLRDVGFGGVDKLRAFFELNVLNADHIRYSVWQLGGAYIGVALPLTAQSQDVWDVVADAPAGQATAASWGRHCVDVIDYDATGVWVVTWGELLKMTWAFWATYVEESYGLVSPDFLTVTGKTPLGLDLPGLIAAGELDAAA